MLTPLLSGMIDLLAVMPSLMTFVMTSSRVVDAVIRSEPIDTKHPWLPAHSLRRLSGKIDSPYHVIDRQGTHDESHTNKGRGHRAAITERLSQHHCSNPWTPPQAAQRTVAYILG